MIVLMAATPSHPELKATLAGYKQKHHWYEKYYNKNLINHDSDTSVENTRVNSSEVMQRKEKAS